MNRFDCCSNVRFETEAQSERSLWNELLLSTGCENMPSDIFSGVTVVLVDDHENLRELIREFLIQKGAQVITCSNATNALEIIKQNSPNVVLSKVGMKDANGTPLLPAIRALGAECGGNIPVIAICPPVSTPLLERESMTGFNAYLRTPFTPAVLLEAIQSAVFQGGLPS